jgi:hypothetical protein
VTLSLGQCPNQGIPLNAGKCLVVGHRTYTLPRIFDNIDLRLHPALTDTLKISESADFCVGYFNLRGWKLVDEFIEAWSGGEGSCCRAAPGPECFGQKTGAPKNNHYPVTAVTYNKSVASRY